MDIVVLPTIDSKYFMFSILFRPLVVIGNRTVKYFIKLSDFYCIALAHTFGVNQSHEDKLNLTLLKAHFLFFYLKFFYYLYAIEPIEKFARFRSTFL